MGDDTGLIKFLTFRPAGNSMHLFSPFSMQEADHRAFDHGIDKRQQSGPYRRPSIKLR